MIAPLFLGLAAALLLQGVLVIVAAFALIVPNPLRVLWRYGTPARAGLVTHELTLSDGCRGWLIPHPTSRRTVLMCHGRSRAAGWLVPLASVLARDFHVMLFDFVGHGRSPGGYCTLGARESESVHAAIDWLEANGHNDVVIYGVSMGGSAVLLALGRRMRACVRGVVTDGSFDTATRVLDHVGRFIPMPRALLRLSEALAGRVAGFEPRAIRPVDGAAALSVLRMHVHGDRDPLVPRAAAGVLASVGTNATHSLYPGTHDQPSNRHLQALVVDFARGVP